MGAGPELREDLSISQGADEPYGIYSWASLDTTDPYPNWQSATWTNFSGFTAEWVVRVEDDNSSTALLTYTSGGGQITIQTYAPPGAPPAPSYLNAFSWSVPNATSSALPVGQFFHSFWMISFGGLRSLYLKGRFTVAPAQ